MHQSFFIIDAFFQGNHSFSSINTIDIINHKNYFFGVGGTLGPYFTENIKFPSCNVCHSHMWYFIDTLQYELCL